MKEHLVLTIECASCHSKYRVPGDAAGKKLRCKKCNAAIRVPGLAAVTPPSRPERETRHPTTPPPLPSRPKPRADEGFDLGSLIETERSAKIDLQEAPTPIPVAPPITVARRAPAAAPAGGRAIAAARDSGPGLVARIGVVNVIFLALLGVLAVAWLISLAGPDAAGIAWPMCAAVAVVAIGMSMLAALRSLLIPFSESFFCGVAYMIVPIYPLYYLLTRWDQMGPYFLMNLKGVVVFFAALFMMGLTAVNSASDGSGPSSPSSPSIPTASVPDEANGEAAAPPGKDVSEIFQPIPADAPQFADAAPAFDATTHVVAIGPYRLDVPDGSRFDHHHYVVFDKKTAWRWKFDPRSAASIIVVEVVPRSRAFKQTRPRFIIDPGSRMSEHFGFEAIQLNAPPEAPYGRLNNLPAVRVKEPDNRGFSYFVYDTDHLVRIAFEDSTGDPQNERIYNAIALSFRRGPDESGLDPMSDEYLARDLLWEDVGERHPLHARGAAAESAVLPYLDHEQRLVMLRAWRLLGRIGGERALAEARAAALDRDPEIANAARRTWRDLAPEEYDAVRAAIVDLSAPVIHNEKASLQSLGLAEPDERRDEVEAVLRKLAKQRPSHELNTLLLRWSSDKTRAEHAAAIRDPARSNNPSLAYEVVKTEGGAALVPVVRAAARHRWDAGWAQRVLVPLGPPVEDELIKILRENDTEAATGAAQILRELGSEKSLGALRATLKHRDAALASAARLAIDAIETRKREKTLSPLQLAAEEAASRAGTEALLGPAIDVGGWSIRPPRDFTRTRLDADAAEWQGAETNGLGPSLSIRVERLTTRQERPTVLNREPPAGPIDSGPTVIMPGGNISNLIIGGHAFTGIWRIKDGNTPTREFTIAGIINRTTYIRIDGRAPLEDRSLYALLELAARSVRKTKPAELPE